MVDKIESLGAKAKVFKQAPSQFNDPKKLFFISGMASPKDALKSLSISTSIHNKRREKLNSKFLDEIGSARLIETDEIFCDAYVCAIGDEFKSFYIDSSHINDYAAERLSVILIGELLH
jgi:hypothetical protein